MIKTVVFKHGDYVITDACLLINVPDDASPSEVIQLSSQLVDAVCSATDIKILDFKENHQ